MEDLMSENCESLAKCGFFKKYNESKQLACKGFIASYCKGAKQQECKRMQFRKQHGQAPSDDMMPNGMMISAK